MKRDKPPARPAAERTPYRRATRMEVQQLNAMIDEIVSQAANLRDAMCDAERNMVVDVEMLLMASRLLNIEACNARSLAVVIERDGAHESTWDDPPF